MTEAKVLAIKDINFVSEAGEKVAGLQFWVLIESVDPQWITGTEVYKIWIPYGSPLEAQVRSLRSGQTVFLETNVRGKVQKIHTDVK